jgi:ribosomal-protein-alanine N-acetyltransferase
MLMHKGTKIINTDRLLLRKYEYDDAADMFKNWANDCDVTKFLSWKPHSTVQDTKEIIVQWVNKYENNIYNWAIELKEIHEIIGGISIVKLDEASYSCEIGYCMSKSYWGIGIMSESLKAVIDYLFFEIGFNRIAATHDTNNIASGKVMIKSGMRYEGTLRQSRLRDNNFFYDLALYSILKNDKKVETNYIQM